VTGYIKKLIALSLSVLLLSSCTVLDKLGFDTYDYMGESVISTHAADSETAEMLLPLLSVLMTDSVVLAEFENMGQAIDLYRDVVLSAMLKNGYSKYSGNKELIDKASKAYPEYHITQIIPAEDFERTMYEAFGGDVKISHKSGSIFKYLRKVECYICNVSSKDSPVKPEITSVEETPKTYRVRFRCVMDDAWGEEYFALIIKREDGTHYIKKLLSAAQ